MSESRYRFTFEGEGSNPVMHAFFLHLSSLFRLFVRHALVRFEVLDARRQPVRFDHDDDA